MSDDASMNNDDFENSQESNDLDAINAEKSDNKKRSKMRDIEQLLEEKRLQKELRDIYEDD